VNIFKKIKKEVGMKRFFVIALALLLALPAISYAGSATSRWDVTIGGYVKVELGYSDQLRANQYIAPYRESKGRKVGGDEYGNWFMTGVQTRFNFLIKGPDVWGMKSMAFIEGDFYGAGGIYGVSTPGGATTANYNNQGGFRLRHAFIKLIDKNLEITFAGNTTQVWGTLTGTGQALLTLSPWLDPGLSIGSGRVPQFNIEYFAMNRELALLFGIFMNEQVVGTNYPTGRMDTFTMGGPFFHGRILYQTDKIGKIGNDKLAFTVNGFWGKEKRAWNAAATNAALTATGTATKWNDKTIDSWGAHGSFFVPILPEKNNNKAGSIGFSAYGWISQNPGTVIGPYALLAGQSVAVTGAGTVAHALASYMRSDGSWAAPTLYGWGPQLYIYFTNNVMLDLVYSELKANLSQRYKNNFAAATNLEKVTQFAAILAYDPNPALKFTLSYDYNKADYSKIAPAADGIGRTGKANVYRFGAFYFF